ncbi:LacI family DNA-binding transcriptional regulator [Microbacterium terricola]|uniref:LacI family transcriptional regulator n=1 Tax=Microbacterium terricola TaxID=344163 RepID=A0ABM8DV12_9MICO|nr:LacI family DNA-binding transcriptional regulator [Microbacterium terricola]UYK39819.1 LacI family transcriptional regulator [Microbacterium terricola]BDV29429.1 LacI family transcriptional regulator [Microbacterium terricola]
MVGIAEVARAAGVSTATVSRALSGRGQVSDAARAKVQAAVDALGYVMSASASSLASGRTRNIGVLVPLLDKWFYATVLSGIADVLSRHGYDIALYNLTDDPAQRAGVFDTSLRRSRIDGLITLTVELSDPERDGILALGMPVVAVGAPNHGIPALTVDDRAVAHAATSHLIALGHREIAHIGSGRAGGEVPARRREGYEQALHQAGIAPRAELFAHADFTIEAGHAAALELLRRTDRPTALFAASDEMAFGALFAARELALDVPGDVSVVGVDGHGMSGFFGLTTVDQFPQAQGERAAHAVLAALGLEAPAGAPELPFELVLRTSTAPPA